LRIYYHGACGLAIVRDTLYRYELLLLLAVVGGQVTGTAQQNGQEKQKYLDVSSHRGANVRKRFGIKQGRMACFLKKFC